MSRSLTAGLVRALRAGALLAVLCVAATGQAVAETRVALVIGNAAYADAPLANPVNDARLMADTLSGLGFQVTALVDADQKAMKRAVRDFGVVLESHGPDAVGLFFFAGHGIQVKGENFLIPVGAPIAREADVAIEAVSASDVLEQLDFAGNRLNIVILDACRNNPFQRSFRSATRGLARMDAPTGSIVAYSTGPGQVAADGDGPSSPYTTALARAIREPGLKIEDAFKQARRDVIAETAEAQVPWESSSLLGDFYFAGAATASAPGSVEAPPPQAPREGTIARARAITDGAAFRDCPDCPEMVALAGGRFRMGSPAEEAGRAAHEGPLRDITVRRFAIGKYEITRGEFADFVAEAGYDTGPGCWYWALIFLFDANRSWQNPGYAQTERDPVACVNWQDAQAYALWLSRKTGARYRLPSEAEWEYAARAGTATARYWGEESAGACAHENTYDRTGAARLPLPWAHADCDDGYVFSAPAGSFAANAFGLHDMLGNAPEWVADCFRPSYDPARTDGAAFTGGDCRKRVLRGGTWANWPAFARSANRDADEPSDRADNYGFRIARELE